MQTIERTFNSTIISQRQDGYIDGTAMCQANNRRFNEYFRLASTQEFLSALSEEYGLPILNKKADTIFPASALVVISRGGNNQKHDQQHTFIHPEIAIHLGMWCNAKFSIQVSKWIKELLTEGVVDIRGDSKFSKTGNKLLNWDAFSSEDALSEAIHSFVVGLCGYRTLERECPFRDLKDKLKTRRLDFITRHARVVTGYELKLRLITVEDVKNILFVKSYLELLSNEVEKFDTAKKRKVRQVQFVLMSPIGISDEAKELLKSIPDVKFISVQSFCTLKLKQALKNKYKLQPWYLINLAKEKYYQLFNPSVLNSISKQYN